MTEKPLEQITFADAKRLVKERWPESKTVDYERDAYIAEGDDERDLLKYDVVIRKLASRRHHHQC